MPDIKKTTALPTPEELAICMVDGSAELANGDVKWSELPPRAQGEWIKKARIALFVVQRRLSGEW